MEIKNNIEYDMDHSVYFKFDSLITKWLEQGPRNLDFTQFEIIESSSNNISSCSFGVNQPNERYFKL